MADEVTQYSNYRVFERAEFFDRIASLFAEFNHANQLDNEEGGISFSTTTSGLLVPRVWINGSTVFCKGRTLELARMPQIKRLFSLFCAAPQQRLSLHELTKIEHGSDLKQECTKELLKNLNSRTIKSVSRARKLAETYLQTGGDWQLQWFVYDYDFKGWYLFRVQNEQYCSCVEN